MKRTTAVLVTLLIGGIATVPSVGATGARHVQAREKAPKTHRILAGSKSVRINDAGEVITTRKP